MTPHQRVGRIVAGVLRQALADAGARMLILLDDGSPEAILARDWCAQAAGDNFSSLEHGTGGWLRPAAAAGPASSVPDAQVLEEEELRFSARLRAANTPGGALLAHPANKTTLLLTRLAPPEPLLPLGDLYASDVRALAGDFSLPAPVRALADEVGGIDALDGALRAHYDERRGLEEALATLAENAREPLRRALVAARFARRHLGLVPKLGARTPGLDLFA